MSEKKQQDSSSTARIRNNQRRSRARHREYVDELKAKLGEYERRGVQATLEMRQAARRVALENSRLRSLLASRGITADQIDRHLASYNDQQTPAALPTIAPPLSSTNPSPPSALATATIIADADPQQTCCGPTTQCSLADDRDVQGGYGAQPSGSLFSGPTSPSSPGPQASFHAAASHLDISCTAAAHIMADMYGDGNAEGAREALGCSGHEECLVKNTMLFQLLES